LTEALESFQRHVHLVVPERQQRQRVLPLAVGGGRAREPGLDVRGGHRGAGDGGTGRVLDVAEDGAGGDLGVQRGCKQQRRKAGGGDHADRRAVAGSSRSARRHENSFSVFVRWRSNIRDNSGQRNRFLSSDRRYHPIDIVNRQP
jgi:hypothetical protein